MSVNLDKWLNQVEDTAIEQIKEGSKGGFNEMFKDDDGDYIGIVTKNEFKESAAGKPGVLTVLTILESDNPQFIGENYLIWNDLEREDAFKFLTWHFKALKVDVTDPSEIIAEFRKNKADLFSLAANKTVVKFTLNTTTAKNGNEYQNAKIKRVYEDGEYDLSNVTLPQEDQGSNTTETGAENTSGEEATNFSEPEPGMKLKFEAEEGVGKNKKTVEKTATIVSLDNEAETLKIKLDDGTEVEIGADQVTELLPEKPVE